MKKIVALFCLLLMSSCVGPTTPFGADDSFMSATLAKVKPKAIPVVENSKVSFQPNRQNMHSQHKLSISIKDQYPDPTKLKIYYNGSEVTKWARLTVDEHQLKVFFEDIKIIAGRENNIHLEYRNKKYIWQKPDCALEEHSSIASTKPFSVPQSTKEHIENISISQNINPALMAAIIAQESSFNPKAMSWAKAIGLTQITNIADEDLKPHSKSWPRNIATRRYPASIVRGLILSGKINQHNEWRLNPKTSIQGGATFLSQTIDYWDKRESLISQAGSPKVDVVLASYNSGKSRVKTELERKGGNFLSGLPAAKHYVEKIKSYCYQFTIKEEF